MGRGRAKAHARGHQVFPVVQHGLHVLRVVVGAVARLVVGLHVGRLRDAAADRHGRPILVDVVRHPFGVREAVGIALAPVVAPGDVEGVDDFFAGIAGNALLLIVVPLEHAVGRDALVHLLGQRGELEVCLVGDEATAVAASAGIVGEGHHVAPLELETADAVVELGRGEGVHVTVRVLEAEVVDRLAAEVGFGVYGEGLEVLAVGHDDGARGIHLHLAVLVVDGGFAVDGDVAQIADGLARADVLQDDDGMLRVGDVYAAGRCERFVAGDDVVHVVGEGDRRGHLFHLLNGVVGHGRVGERKGRCKSQ